MDAYHSVKLYEYFTSVARCAGWHFLLFVYVHVQSRSQTTDDSQ